MTLTSDARDVYSRRVPTQPEDVKLQELAVTVLARCKKTFPHMAACEASTLMVNGYGHRNCDNGSNNNNVICLIVITVTVIVIVTVMVPVIPPEASLKRLCADSSFHHELLSLSVITDAIGTPEPRPEKFSKPVSLITSS